MLQKGMPIYHIYGTPGNIGYLLTAWIQQAPFNSCNDGMDICCYNGLPSAWIEKLSV